MTAPATPSRPLSCGRSDRRVHREVRRDADQVRSAIGGSLGPFVFTVIAPVMTVLFLRSLLTRSDIR